MRAKSYRLIALLALAVPLATSAPAWAGLPVAYDADYKSLKKNVFIGDPLGFEVYETADCSGAPVYSEILAAGTPEVSVEQIKPVPAKKQKPKPQTIARLRATLDVPVVGAALYLKVAADGVVPVGGECQAQVAGVVGVTPAGIAYDNDRVAVVLTGGPTFTTVETITLQAPADGHILVTTAGSATCYGVGGTYDLSYLFRVTESDATVTSTLAFTNQIPADEWVRFSSVHAQSVVAGATTVELFARCRPDDFGGSMGADLLSALFVPNLYQ